MASKFESLPTEIVNLILKYAHTSDQGPICPVDYCPKDPYFATGVFGINQDARNQCFRHSTRDLTFASLHFYGCSQNSIAELDAPFAKLCSCIANAALADPGKRPTIEIHIKCSEKCKHEISSRYNIPVDEHSQVALSYLLWKQGSEHSKARTGSGATLHIACRHMTVRTVKVAHGLLHSFATLVRDYKTITFSGWPEDQATIACLDELKATTTAPSRNMSYLADLPIRYHKEFCSLASCGICFAKLYPVIGRACDHYDNIFREHIGDDLQPNTPLSSNAMIVNLLRYTTLLFKSMSQRMLKSYNEFKEQALQHNQIVPPRDESRAETYIDAMNEWLNNAPATVVNDDEFRITYVLFLQELSQYHLACARAATLFDRHGEVKKLVKLIRRLKRQGTVSSQQPALLSPSDGHPWCSWHATSPQRYLRKARDSKERAGLMAERGGMSCDRWLIDFEVMAGRIEVAVQRWESKPTYPALLEPMSSAIISSGTDTIDTMEWLNPP